MTCSGTLCAKIEGVEVARKYRDVARAEIGHRRRIMLQFRESEERRGGRTERELDRAVAFLDLVLGHLLGHLLRIQIGMRPGMRADGVTGCGDLPEKFRVIHRVLADREEHGLGALVGERLEHRGRIDGPWTVVEGQHDFLVGQEIELLEMLETEAGSARGVDLDHAGNPERIGIGASLFRLRRRGCRYFFRNTAGGLDRIEPGGGFCGGGWGRGSAQARRRWFAGRPRCGVRSRTNRQRRSTWQPPTLISIRPNALRMVTLSLIPKLKFAPPSLSERVVNAPQTRAGSRPPI